MNDGSRFWRNLIIITVLHLVVIFGVFWLARDPKNSGGGSGESVVWMDPSAFTGSKEPEATPEPTPEPQKTPEPTPEPTPEETPLPPRITADDSLNVKTPAPTPKITPTPHPTSTPKPTPRPTPRKTPTPTPRPKAKPTPTPRPTPRKTPKPKVDPDEDATPKPKPKASATPRKASAEEDETPTKKIPKAEAVKSGEEESSSASQKTAKGKNDEGGEGTGVGNGKGSGEGPGVDPGLVEAYNNMLKNRFTGAWDQPRAEIQTDNKFVVTMLIVVNKDGTVADTSLAHSSGNTTVDESVAEAAKSITRLPAPPTGKTYPIKINFVLGDE